MTAVESYMATENHNENHDDNVVPIFDTNVAVLNPVVPPQVAAPISSFDGGESTPAVSGEKRKRGRPRKYPVDGSLHLATRVANTTENGKRRGRPPGSVGKKHAFVPTGSPAAVRFATQIITVQAGEDVSSKIISLCQNASQAVCILSANGAISNVTLRQASSAGGTVTYEGRFEILSLSGSFVVLESGGQRSRTGGMSVSLAGPDGRILGGGVAGLLIAATPVQVVVGSFDVGQETKSPNHVDYSAGPSNPINGSPIMRGESSGSPVNRSNSSNNNNMGMVPWK